MTQNGQIQENELKYCNNESKTNNVCNVVTMATEAWVHFQASHFGIWGARSGTGHVFLPVLGFPLSVSFHQFSALIYSTVTNSIQFNCHQRHTIQLSPTPYNSTVINSIQFNCHQRHTIQLSPTPYNSTVTNCIQFYKLTASLIETLLNSTYLKFSYGGGGSCVHLRCYIPNGLYHRCCPQRGSGIRTSG